MKATAPVTACALAVLLSGCSATIELNKPAADPARKVALRDARSAQEKVYRRDGVLEPVQFFGDADFDSPPLTQFSLLLGSKLPPGNYDLEVSQFRIIDIFPQRLQAGTAGALTGALGSVGYAAYFSGVGSATQDNITCLVSGSLQSKVVSASVSVPYKVSPLAGLVKNDPSFKGAANECLSLLSEKVAKSL